MALSDSDTHRFWFYMTLSDGRQTEQIPLPSNDDQAHLASAIQDVVKRFSPGLLKTLAVVSQPADAINEGLGGEQFAALRQSLSGSVRWLDTDLKDGRVPGDADMLMVLEPMGMQQYQVFAIDQFLMQGGTVVIASAPQDVVQSGDNVTARAIRSGVANWLSRYGLTLGNTLVLDRQSGALPIPVKRNIGGEMVEELELASYPYIVDVRGAGLSDNPITRDLQQIDVPWVAPIDIDARRNQDRKVTVLLRSSSQSWLSNSPNLTDFDVAPSGAVASYPLAVMLEGRFDSAFAGQPSPLASIAPAAPAPPAAGTDGNARTAAAASAASINSVIDHSPPSARLIVVGSSTAFSDQVLELLGQALGRAYDKPSQLVQNIVDWSLADQGLMSIRGREQLARTLTPLTPGAQKLWEYLNYGVALGALALVWLLNRRRRARRAARHLAMLPEA
jgi:ABC-2 type transport system permease protein